ncbi:cysteine hydrolase [Nocardia sp. NBC_01499]|uniref:cysteine hydrolase family protein n=1 Tax=Nocardia sp. NBC_01499 TaxID=2903597 RepID=UPI0038685F18
MQTSQSAPSTALLVVDLQEWIVDLSLVPRTGAEIVHECARLVAACAAAGIPVIPVRYLREDGADGGEDAPENRLVPQISPAAAKVLITKNGLDAFEGTAADGRGLEDILRNDYGADSLIIAGIATPHGVGVTAISAVQRGFHAAVISDATGAGSDEEHEAALAKMKSEGVVVLTAAAVSLS